MPRQMSRPNVPTYRASTAVAQPISRWMPTLTWWTCADFRFGSMPQKTPVALSAICWASVRSSRNVGAGGSGMPPATVANRLRELDCRAQAGVSTRRRTGDRRRVLVDERQRVAAAHSRLAVLRDVPGKADSRAEVVHVLLVHVAVYERHARVGIEHHLIERLVENRQKPEVIVFTQRAVVLPLEPAREP